MLTLKVVAAVVLTQGQLAVPDDFLKRPEVRAYAGPPLAMQEAYARSGKVIVATVYTAHGGQAHPFVLDAGGRVAADATLRLVGCLPKGGSKYLALVTLIGGRGVAVADTCVVRGTRPDDVAPAVETWGDEWRSLIGADNTSPDELKRAVFVFRHSAEYAALTVARDPALDAFHLPESPYDIVVATLQQVDGFDPMKPPQKLFVVHAKTGTTDLVRTEALARELRDEVVSTCGQQPFTLSPSGRMLQLFTEGGRWGEGSCSAALRWDAEARQIRAIARGFNELVAEQMLEGGQRSSAEAERLWMAGKKEQALAKWNEALQLAAASPGLAAAICRTLSEATADSSKAVGTLQSCLSRSTDAGEVHLVIARRLVAAGKTTEALAHYEHALAGPLSAEDRADARRAVVKLELQLAEDDRKNGRKRAARAHYEQLLATDLSRAQRTQVKAALKELP